MQESHKSRRYSIMNMKRLKNKKGNNISLFCYLVCKLFIIWSIDFPHKSSQKDSKLSFNDEFKKESILILIFPIQ